MRNAELRVQTAAQIIAGIDSLLSDPDLANIQALLRVHAKAMGLHVSQ
ncbi:MAG: hypothetical protein HY000_28210 [Planctomycetes bacterium]|nr:hypothetical protein [Planctomycetota bacterium]